MNSKVKKEIIRTRKSIKNKFDKLQKLNYDSSDMLHRTFKPIIDPLENILENVSGFNKVVTADSSLEKTKVKEEIIKHEEENLKKDNTSATNDDDEIFEHIPETPEIKKVQDIISTKEGEEEFIKLSKTLGPIASKYILEYIFNDGKFGCKYGIRKDPIDGEWKIGNKNITIEKDDINIDGQWYEGTEGLYELLFSKNPNPKLYTEKDLQLYKNILMITNAHKKKYESNALTNANRSHKYKNIIRMLFNTPTKTGESIFKNFNRNSHPEYIYYQDLNVLIERLRLLLASQQAGNTSHENEILSIEEELRKNKIIK